MDNEQSTGCSEITILPDGRLYVLGMSEELLQIVQELQTGNKRVDELTRRLREGTKSATLVVGKVRSSESAKFMKGE